MAVRKRKLVRRCAVILIAVLLVIVALPLWFPWTARRIARAFGVTYSTYQREGYGHFRLDNVTFTNEDGALHAKQVVALVPTAWLWRLVWRSDREPFVQAHSWEYISFPTTNATSVYTNLSKLSPTLGTVARWVPTANLTNGAVQAGKLSLIIPHATWANRQLSGDLALPGNRALTVWANFPPGAPLKLSAQMQPADVRSEWSFVVTDSALRLEGTALWLSNRMDLLIGFPRRGTLPETASVRVDSFDIPASRLGLEQYRNLTGTLRAAWATNQFLVDVTASAAPKSATLPPLDLQAHASGNTNAVRIDSLRVSAPWLNASLSESTTINFTPPFLSRPVALSVLADFSKQPWLAATGTVRGTATLFPSERLSPRITFALTGDDLSTTNFHSRTVRAEGEFDWPILRLAPAHIAMVDGSEADASGVLNLETKTVLDGALNFNGSFGREFLADGYSFERASLAAKFRGPISQLEHSGRLQVDNARLPQTEPMQLELEWTGRALELNPLTAAATAGNSAVQFRGAASVSGVTNQFQVAALTLRVNDTNELQLEKTFQAELRKTTSTEITATDAWRLAVQPAHWTGPGRELLLEGNIAWPTRGDFRVSAQNLTSDLVKDFVPLPVAQAALRQFAFNGNWSNGPVVFNLKSGLELKTKEQLAFFADAALTGGSNGLSIQQLSVVSATQVVGHAEGIFPVTLEPANTNGLVRIQADAPLRFNAATEPGSILWTKIAEATGLQLIQPNLTMAVTGSWVRPQGQFALAIERLQLPESEHPWPKLENVDVHIDLNRDAARVSRFNLLIEGQPLQFTAEVPLGESFWPGLSRQKYLPDWHQATAELKADKVDLAPFARFAPGSLAPQGEASVDVTLARGGRLGGGVVVQNARTQPIASLGPVRNIGAQLMFAGTTVILTNAHGEIGGQSVTAHGSAGLTERVWRDRQTPQFQLRLHGTNVPLVRQMNVVLRADMDLAITNRADYPAITGQVQLHDGFLLSDLKDLVPGNVTTPALRPPYFSIVEKPWADWHLDVRVNGVRFLKVRSPLFVGTVSTTLKVEGTLKDPVALGDARIDTGAVTFPFGTLPVRQGYVSLASDNPHRPKIYIIASARRMNYEVKMEVTGNADAPIVQFSSNPPLSSEQIVLMLTAGQMPPGLTASTTQERASGVAFFVGKNFLSELGIGDPGEDRLTIRSGEKLTETGQPTYDIEYKFTDRWSAVGEYDRFSQYNLDLKWKVFSK